MEKIHENKCMFLCFHATKHARFHVNFFMHLHVVPTLLNIVVKGMETAN